MDKKTEIMYDHYKDSFINQKNNEKLRNKLFLILIGLLFLLLLMTLFPNNIYQNIKEIVFNMYGINITFELNLIEIFVWFFILYVTIRYYQLNVNIEKNYKYIHKLESNLTKKYKLDIYREGNNYIQNYPMFLHMTYKFYKYIFPALYCICILFKVFYEIVGNYNIAFIIFKIILSLTIISMNISYICFNYKISKGGD